MPAEVGWVAVMDRVGGYRSLVLIEGDRLRYQQLIEVMNAEGEYREMERRKAESKRH